MEPRLTSTVGPLRRVVRYGTEHRHPERYFGVAYATPAAGPSLEHKGSGATDQQARHRCNSRVDQGPGTVASWQGFLLYHGLRNRHAVGERPVAEILDSLDEQLGVSIRRPGRLPRLVV